MKNSVSSATDLYKSLLRKHVKRGLSGHPLYMTWINMMRRCYDPREVTYYMYGAVGVIVCERWHDKEKFFEDMHPKPSPKLTLDRVDGAQNYNPDNCRWATIYEQNGNKRTNHRVALNGRTEHIAEWGRILGMPACLIRARLKMGWPVERALNPKLAYRKSRLSGVSPIASSARDTERPSPCSTR